MKKQTGLTLVELMIVTLVLVILASTGVPLLKNFIDNNNIRTYKSTFEKTITYARNEAVQQGKSVRITPISNTPSATPHDWSNGWLISFVDPITNNLELIRRFDSPGKEIIFTSEEFGPNANQALEIRPTGQVNKSGTFTLNQKNCSGGKRYIFNIMLSSSISKRSVACN